MKGERVDIIDESGTLIGVTFKDAAHRDGLLHAVVIGAVRDSVGNRVLVRQASDRQDAGQFVNPVGGHVQAGESLDDALRREVAEEIGWTNFNLTRIGAAVFSRTVLGRHENHLFNVYDIHSDEPMKLSDEAVEIKTFAPDEHRLLIKENPSLFGDAHHFVLNAFPKYFLD